MAQWISFQFGMNVPWPLGGPFSFPEEILICQKLWPPLAGLIFAI